MSDITLSQLAAIFETTPKATLTNFVDPFNKTFEVFDITSMARQCAFLAQVGHESANLTATVENLNYSQQGLLKIFGKYFKTEAAAARYARKPELIASCVYANRMGNGDEASKDGWTYRGRGLIQLTGKNNYVAFAKFRKESLEDTVTYMSTPEGAAMSAGWFWSNNGLNVLADQGRFTDITRRINGGVNGMADRQALWGKAKKTLIS